MTALCRHFGVCGGCAHQGMTEYRAFKRSLVVDALARHNIEAVVEDAVEVAPATRRRATFKALKGEGGVALGFMAARTHDIVDLRECLVLTPRLAALVARLRGMLAALLGDGEAAELRLADTDTGVDLSLRWQRASDAATVAELARWATELKLARVARHGETLIELARPCVRFGKADVFVPSEAFLQPTRQGEAALQAFVLTALSGAKHVADLFAGCGTFALPLAERARVHAVEIEGSMLEALAAAARTASGLKRVTVEKRNLFRRPLGESELSAFDAVALDPPRVGALAQVQALVRSKVKRVAYVSCDAESFARDARVMVDHGFRLGSVVPVDQFLWSSHIELAASFER
ncbi:MAG: class I SAM-dependent RNA methyltransferase [Alphaproteobacteria bacterium]|nr:class I SAM-dependent RNA methyltransferase [Alphaproteobacteria bacterium]MDE2631027.1 class I SAM-dependent RNA methyltransferase [Alphaproteobacteria bacterium]